MMYLPAGRNFQDTDGVNFTPFFESGVIAGIRRITLSHNRTHALQQKMKVVRRVVR
jgi:hypothetical protein